MGSGSAFGADSSARAATPRRAELQHGRLFGKAPKSAAGVRSVSFPAELLDDVTHHLEQFAAPGRDGHVFVGPQGGQLRPSNFRDDWVKARKAAGVTAVLHFHDLRPTGNTLASTAGASTRELMTRMGRQQLPGRADLPAHDQRPGSDHRGPARGHDPRGRGRGLRLGDVASAWNQPVSGVGNGLAVMVEAGDAGSMPGQRKRRRQQQDEAQRAAARYAPDAGRWEVLFETQDEPEWHAHISRLRASDTQIDWTAMRVDRLCGRQTQTTTFRLSLFVPKAMPDPGRDSSTSWHACGTASNKTKGQPGRKPS